MRVTTCSKRLILESCGLEDLVYQVDPYVGCGHYCSYCYALNHAETDWREEVRVHEDLSGRLFHELLTIPPQTIYMGYNSDPYQPVEAEQRQTRKALELFVETGHSASFLTKSDLFARDFDLLTRMEDARVSISVAFNDDATRRLFEHDTTPTEMRMDALKQAQDAGLQTSALLCPIIPYVTDAMELLDSLAPVTDTIWVYGLTIRDRNGLNWKNVEAILAGHYPANRKRIEEVVFDREHAYWRDLRTRLEKAQLTMKPELKIHI